MLNSNKKIDIQFNIKLISQVKTLLLINEMYLNSNYFQVNLKLI